MTTRVSLDLEDFRALVRGEIVTHDSREGKIQFALQDIGLQAMTHEIQQAARESNAERRSLEAPSGKEALGYSSVTVDVWFTGNQREPDVEAVVRNPKKMPFAFLMVAAEHLMKMTAQRSRAGFERALELMCQGATSVKGVEERRRSHGGS
jgi:hypothetical protein